MGGLGTPVAQYLTAAGVGTLGLLDHDRVELSNLQRQVLYGDEDVGHLKADVAARRLQAMNAGARVDALPLRLDPGNALQLFRDYDVVIDGTDNFASRYLINDAAYLTGIPVIHGSVLRYEGRVSVFGMRDGPCYRCLFPEPPPPGVVPDCGVAGVLGATTGLVGTLMANEAIKLVCGIGTPLSGRLLLVNSLGPTFQTVAVPRSATCPLCGTREISALGDYEAMCGPHEPEGVARLSPADVATRLRGHVQLIDVREPWEWAICRLDGAELIPLGTLPHQAYRLDPSVETILYCHQGVRSMAAARFLAGAGFHRLGHLEGGIDRWSVELDSRVTRY
jgi:adenylyltransferase/sulfurtransferase